MVKSIFLNRQNTYKITIANTERNHTITSEGIAIYLPSTPEVLINNVAKIIPDRFLMWLVCMDVKVCHFDQREKSLLKE